VLAAGGCCCIQADGLRHLRSMTQLRQICLAGAYGVALDALRHLSPLAPTLESLDLGARDLWVRLCFACFGPAAAVCARRAFPADMLDGNKDMSSMRRCSLQAAAMYSSANLAPLATMTELRDIDLSGDYCLRADALLHVARLPRLRRLDLAGCSGIDGAAVPILNAMSALRSVALDGSAVPGALRDRTVWSSAVVHGAAATRVGCAGGRGQWWPRTRHASWLAGGG
jgi:hypothetical protein